MGGAADHRCGIGGHCRRSLAREAPCKAAGRRRSLGSVGWVAHSKQYRHETVHAESAFKREKGARAKRLHGGASGSGGPPGKRNGQYRHGERTKAAIAERQKLSALLKMLRAGLR